MKKYSAQVVVGFFVTVVVVMLWSIMTSPTLDPRLQAKKVDIEFAKLELKRQHLRRNADLGFYGVLGVLSMAGLTALIIATGFHRAKVKRASVHRYKIGNSEIMIHERDLSMAWPIATGLVNAEALERINGGLERALQLYATMADVQSRQIRALTGKRGAVLDVQPEERPALSGPVDIPSFSDLLRSGEIAPGKPLIFGFDKHTGKAETGGIEDAYSTIIIGISGGGKTTFLAFFIASSILSTAARFDILDLHYPAAESLGSSLGDLLHAESLTLISNPFCLEEKLQVLEQELERRLKLPPETMLPPHILVVDEHEQWVKHSEHLVNLEIRIINEGRKVKMYLFLTSKSAKADKIGDSALRDNMVTSYVFNTKKANARTFFKDEDKVKLLKEVTPPGEAIFTDRKDRSLVVKTPLATIDDMRLVAAMVNTVGQRPVNDQVNREVNRLVNGQRIDQRVDHALTSENRGVDLVDQVNFFVEKGAFKQGELADRLGVDRGFFSKILKRQKSMPNDLRQKTAQILLTESIN